MRSPRAITLAVLLCATGALAGGARADQARDRAWHEDLATFAAKLREVHPKPFAHVAEARFDSALAALDQRLPQMSDAEVCVGFMRLVAMLGDGHTLVLPTSPAMGFGRVIPVRLFAYDDGLAIAAVGPEYARFAGARVLRIGALTSDEALRRAVEVSPGDNEMTRLDRATFFLTMPSVLSALGIAADSGRVAFEVRTVAGATERFVARAAPDTTHAVDWFFEGERVPVPGALTLHDGAAAPLPLHLRDPDGAWWYEWLPDRRLLYVQFRRVQPFDHGQSFTEFVRRLFAASDSLRPEALAIDLRHNHGGNNMILQPLIHALIKRDTSVNRRGHLFTIIGRGTFSAAMNCANWLEENTQTMFVGEPTGGRPNHYGDNQQVPLPHHPDLLVFVSHWPWQARLPWDDRPWIAPHLVAPMTLADARANRDPALEAIRVYTSEPTLVDRLRTALEPGARTTPETVYRDYKGRHPDRWGRTTESDIDQLGRDLIREHRAAQAITVMTLNVESYPGSADAREGLGDAWLASGDSTRAIGLLREALKLDPGSRSARRRLDALTRR